MGETVLDDAIRWGARGLILLGGLGFILGESPLTIIQVTATATQAVVVNVPDIVQQVSVIVETGELERLLAEILRVLQELAAR